MDIDSIKLDLIKWIIDMNDPMVISDFVSLQKEYQALIANTEWDSLSDAQRARIEQSLQEAENGDCHTFEEVTARLREKYNLNN